VLTPARRRGIEILDDPAVDPAVRERSIGDVTRSNQLLGGLRAAAAAMRDTLNDDPDCRTVLDVGTGLADIPSRVRTEASRAGIVLEVIGVDEACSLLAAARLRLGHAVCANALALPFRDHSIDIVMCSQLLHHFEAADAERLVAELSRVARRAVIVSDLRRSWIAAAGFWIISFPLRFHRVTRHDGVTSVLRGFTRAELTRIVRNATGRSAVVRRRVGFRLTARWKPGEPA
jgi:ubiquinone/menaquinone biosynthesis C-methylase UbiE